MKLIQIIFVLSIILVSCKESTDKNLDNSHFVDETFKVDDNLNEQGDNNSIPNNTDWTELETISKAEKLELIQSLKQEFEYLATYDTWKEENLMNFHFLDLDSDDDLDFIFDGWSGGEPTCVRVYLNIDNTYNKVFDEFQEITAIELGKNGLTSLSIQDPGCCASYITFNMDFQVETSKDKMNFLLVNRTARIQNTELPTNELKEPVRFEIENEIYYLRATPKIDTTNLWYEGDEGEGNIIAELKKGDQGRAIGKSTDSTGRVWWFVEIDPEFKPNKSYFYDLEERPTKVTGWMSSRFVKEIK